MLATKAKAKSSPWAGFSWRRLEREVRVVASCMAKTYPVLFQPIARLRENSKRILVRKDTDLVVEGYWRCGNHFATYAFETAQERPVHVAHHFHAPAQLILATRWNVPAVLLIREPIAAIASATVFLESANPLPLLKFYNIFHRALLPCRHKVVVADFSQTVNDFGRVIARVNERYGTSYHLFKHCAMNEQHIKNRIQTEHDANMGGKVSSLPLPSSAKSKLKQKVTDRLCSGEFEKELATARALYEELRACAALPIATATARQPVAARRFRPPVSVQTMPVQLESPAKSLLGTP